MEVIQKWLTVLVASAAFFVALMQWWVARKRLRLDFYDRRYRVFDALRNFMAGVVQEARVSNEARATLYRETTPAQFLFGRDIQEYIGLVHQQANALTLVLADAHPIPLPAGYDPAQKQLELNLWFGDQVLHGGLENAFMPYLDFQKVR